MYQYVLRRLVQLIPTLLGMSILIFLFIHLIPGDVVDVQVGTTMGLTEEQLQGLREYYGLNQPLHIQYVEWLASLLRGDFGISIRSGKPVLREILVRYPVTIEIAVAAIVISLGLGIPLGILSALRRDKPVDLGSRVFALLGLSLPHFWIGALLIIVLSRTLRWMPNTAGYVNFTADPATNLKQILFPSVALGIGMAAAIMRQTRSSVLDVLGQDYIRTARAKGLGERAVLVRHCLRNALLVVLTLTGIQMGYLLGGVVVIEEVFALPGLGRLLLNAVLQRDYALVQGTGLFLALNFVLINLVVDIIYGFADPRVRFDE